MSDTYTRSPIKGVRQLNREGSSSPRNTSKSKEKKLMIEQSVNRLTSGASPKRKANVTMGSDVSYGSSMKKTNIQSPSKAATLSSSKNLAGTTSSSRRYY